MPGVAGTFPQGPWQSVYLVRSGATAPLITDVVPQITPRHGYPSEPLTDSDNAWTIRYSNGNRKIQLFLRSWRFLSCE